MHGLRVLGIDLEGAAQVVEGLQVVTLFAEDGAQIFESHRVPGICRQSLHGEFLGLLQVALLLVGDPQGHIGMRVLRCALEAAVQQL